MAGFTLRVVEQGGFFYPDSRHTQGGMDLLQIAAFKHLFPEGYCNYMLRTLLYDMAEIHGWRVELIK